MTLAVYSYDSGVGVRVPVHTKSLCLMLAIPYGETGRRAEACWGRLRFRLPGAMLHFLWTQDRL